MNKTKTPILKTELRKDAFAWSADLPDNETVNEVAIKATAQTKKKVTKKNTMVANAMFETELFTKAKVKAATERTTFSAIVNDALREYLNK